VPVENVWMAAATEEFRRRSAERLRPRFKLKEWSEFEHRLEVHLEPLFRLLYDLYGWRYDFAWVLDSLLGVAADGYLARGKRLRRDDRSRDRRKSSRLEGPATTWVTTYVDSFAGQVEHLEGQVGFLQRLGATHLHLLPPFLVPEGANDGGFAVSDYRRLRPDLGTTADLARVIQHLRGSGIGVVLDLIANHTSFDHPWARSAAAGDPDYSGFYFMLADRPEAGAYRLRPALPGTGNDPFTWHPEVAGGTWIWTTFHPFQWDLNYANPAVLAAICSELVFLANLGATAIRLGSARFIWKTPGTDCEDLPQAHLLVQVMRRVLDIAAPSVVLVSDPGSDSFVTPAECWLGYDQRMMGSIWDAIATADTRLLRGALGRPGDEDGRCWIGYLRDHDDFGWTFTDQEMAGLGVDPSAHRRALDAYYSGEGSDARATVTHPPPGNGRISGTLASLAGLESALERMDPAAVDLAVRRILAAWAMIVGSGRIPMLFLSDAIASLNDYGDPQAVEDPRWIHRPRLNAAAMARAVEGRGPEGAVHSGLVRLLEIRRAHPQLSSGLPPELIDPGDRAVIAFRRGPFLMVVNFSSRPAVLDRAALGSWASFDLIGQEEWPGHVIGPYEYRWLTPSP
jgi:amylosucrase